MKEFYRRIRSLGDEANANVARRLEMAWMASNSLTKCITCSCRTFSYEKSWAVDPGSGTSEKARNRKKMHLLWAPCGGQGQKGQAAPVATGAGWQPMGTDTRIDQLVSRQSDFLTRMQKLTAMMYSFVISIIPAPLGECAPNWSYKNISKNTILLHFKQWRAIRVEMQRN